MAPELRRWTGALLLGMGLITVWALPLDHEPTTEQSDLGPQLARFEEVQRQVQLEREHIRRLDWLDSLTALVNDRTDAPTLVVGAPAETGTLYARLGGLERVLRNELAGIGRPQGTLGLFVMQPEDASPFGSSALAFRHDEYYVGRSTHGPYCFVLRIPPSPATGESPAAEPTALAGPCRFMLRYGPPGLEIGSWLKGGSFGRGSGGDERNYRFYVERVAQSLATERLTPLSVAAHQCLEGNVEVCAEIFLHPKPDGGEMSAGLLAAVPELWGIDRIDADPHHLGVIEPFMFADLERQFGSERFGRFWSSDSDVSAAFEAAFGVAPGAWMRDWARSHYVKETTLLAGVGHWAATFLALLVSLLAVTRVSKRRRIT